MYKALIVDDEKIERDGVKFLIDELGLNLETNEAENGVKALQFLQSREVDILFTDIRMPFMDGLELAAKAKAIQPKLKVIIVSAYGDFEYAKQAIRIQVVHYLLKPVEVAEFLGVVTEVIRLCDEEQNQRARSQQLQQVYEIGSRYVQEQMLLQLLQGSRFTNEKDTPMPHLGWMKDSSSFRLLLLDMREKFFDAVDDSFESQLTHILMEDCHYVNLNEYQSVLFLRMEDHSDKSVLETMGLRLQRFLLTHGQVDSVLVFSRSVHDIAEIPNEYHEMERVLESKFFVPPSAVLFTEAPGISFAEESPDPEPMLEELIRHIGYGEPHLICNAMERLFALLQMSKRSSTIYVKYMCTEIAKKYIQSLKRSGPQDSFQPFAERIFRTESLMQLKELMLELVAEKPKHAAEPSRKVITEVLKLIHRDYRQDIGLELLAEKACLSPSYLSHLFKKETGASLVKYITCYRLEKAGELLRTTNLKIVDISMEVGYTSFAYFCSIFKNYYGTTPAKYREGVSA